MMCNIFLSFLCLSISPWRVTFFFS
jgi:hypothetical protein